MAKHHDNYTKGLSVALGGLVGFVVGSNMGGSVVGLAVGSAVGLAIGALLDHDTKPKPKKTSRKKKK